MFDPTDNYKKEFEKKDDYVFDMYLPFPVSANALHIPVQNRICLTYKARDYYNTMKDLLQKENIKTLKGRLSAEIWVYEPNKIRRDINNITKSLFDALEMCKVYENDHQIDETIIRRCECYKGGRIRVRIKEISDKDNRLNISEMEKAKLIEDKEQKRNYLLNKLKGR